MSARHVPHRWSEVLAAARRRLVGPRAGDDAVHARLLEAVARALRAGAAPTGALREAAASIDPGRVADDLRAALAMVERGAPLGDALSTFAAADGGPARQLAAAALALGAEVGGAWARALDGAAAGLRDRAEVAREVRALTSQARSSAAVMVLAPLGFAAYAWTTDPRIAAFALGHPLGWACLTTGFLLDVVGAAWMRALAGGVS
jgi:tight adherence protein B